LVPQNIQGQDNSTLREIYTQAENDYQLGRLEQALESLHNNINAFQGNLKQSVYRLMALCYLGQDDIEQSKNYVSLLLKENPYYTSVQDPIRFENMIKQMKSGQVATIITASSQAESLDEVPVPVTLITEDMIENCGARTLKELLINYVPGITNVESNEETNFSMRGIYSAGQENVLILLDGHRMNSFSTNVANPDFSMSLDKVKQIEILRGPASSLYGGVAYTGVVNIITKKGVDISGFSGKAGIGNYGQMKGGFIFGNRYMDMDIFAWGDIYNSTGQKIHYNADEQPNALFPIDGDIYIGAFNKSPSYDFGTKISMRGLQLLYNCRFSKMQSPYTMSVMFAPYRYEDYRTFNGYAPGYALNSHHGELSYTHTWHDFDFKAALKIDREMQQRYQIVGDTVDDFGYNDIVPYGTTDTIKAYYGYYQNHFWQSTTIGSNIQGDYSYKIGELNGHILLGADFNRFYLMDSNYSEGDEYGQVKKTYDEVHKVMISEEGVNSKNLAKGHETMIDCYLQLKQRVSHRAILNAGIRYDYKQRNDSPSGSRNKHVFSPRVAFIYNLNSWNLKASYSKSFVDAPYFYRNSSLDIASLDFYGLELEPEYMDSWQFSVMNSQLAKGLNFDANFYYNHAKDIIQYYQAYGLYMNAGYLKTLGVELTLNYNNKRLIAHGNFSWQKVLDSENYTATDNRVYNVPPIQSNIVLAYKVSDAFRLHANTTITSKQLSQSISLGGYIVEDVDIPTRAILNAGASYNLSPLTFELNVYNLLNHKYYQGGNSSAPIQQQGLWFLFNISVKL